MSHAERGAMTLEDQANMLLGHDLYHIDQLSEFWPRRWRLLGEVGIGH